MRTVPMCDGADIGRQLLKIDRSLHEEFVLLVGDNVGARLFL